MRRGCVMLTLLASVLCSVCSEDGGIAEKLSGSADMTGSVDRPGYSEKWGWGMYGCTTAYLNTTYTDDDGSFHTEYKELAKYGECIENDAYGLLVHVTSLQKSSGPNQELVEEHTGCRMPLVPGPLPTEPWIALIKRGGCNFQNKVENAYNSNASAVIVYDDKQSLNLQKMRLSSATRNISAVFTYKWKGENLAQLLDDGNKVYIGIAVGNPCDRPYNLNRTSVLFVSVSFIVLLVISLAWLIFYYVQRFRYIHAKDRLSRRLCSAAKKALSKIPTKSIKAEDKELQGDGECCAICIEPFKVSDILRLLPCKHEFHKSCIDPWLLDQRTCPMCKMDILKHYGFVFTGSQESILHLEVEEGHGDNVDSRTTSPIPLTPEPEVLSVRPSQDNIPQAASVYQRPAEVNDPETVMPSSTKLEFEQEISSPTSDAALPRQETEVTKK